MKTYNIIYDGTIDLSSLLSSLETEGCQINEVLEELKVINLRSDGISFSELSGIISVEEDTLIIANAESNTFWHLQRISKRSLPLPQMHYFISTGQDQVIYLVDSGINEACTELSGSISNGNIQNLYSYDETFEDTDGHGTSLASVIVGDNVGVSPDVTVKIVKIPLEQEIQLFVLLRAFNAILEDHLLSPEKVKIVNCSWTIPKSFTLDTKIRELQDAGLVVVAAAGNQLDAADNYSPAGLDTVIGVGASDTFDRVISWATLDGVSKGSNWGPEVDIFAPGIDVTVSNLHGNLVEISGTSVAAAITSAIIAQFSHLNPTLTANLLQETVINLAIEDVLFRNEEIYENTPNKLLIAPAYEITNMWTPDYASLIPVKKGEILRIPLSVSLDIDHNITCEDFVQFNGGVIKKWEWSSVELIDEQYELVIDATDLDLGKYVVNVRAILENGNSVRGKYTIGCYLEDETELTTITEEIYEVMDDENTLVVVSRQCFGPNDCPKGTYCYNPGSFGECRFMT